MGILEKLSSDNYFYFKKFGEDGIEEIIRIEKNEVYRFLFRRNNFNDDDFEIAYKKKFRNSWIYTFRLY